VSLADKKIIKSQKDLKIGILVFSRYSSRRLPGKVLKPINDKPMLSYLLDRLMLKYDKNQIVLATSDEISDDKISEFANEYGVNCFRGSLPNVALRFMEAAKSMKFDYAVRITGDSVFIDTEIIEKLISKIEGGYDLISNRKYKTYPIGQTIEVIKIDTFEKMYPKFSTPEHFEHVTEYFYNNEEEEGLNIYHHKNEDGIFSEISLAIDTHEDFVKASSVIHAAGKNINTLNYKSIYQMYTNLKK
jgi:spore coat polysaccharide biosynthesis protein SpsF